MNPEGLNQDERTYLIEAIYRIVGQVERKFDSLRDADLDALRMFRLELSARLSGFPEQYATKSELEQAALALRALEATVLSRQIYEQQHQVLEDQVLKQDREKLEKSVFDTFIENYRLDLEKAAADRHNVVETLGHATNQVRDQIIQERGEYVPLEVYQRQHLSLTQRIEGTERWQYKIVGGLVFATFVAPLVTGIVVWVISKGF